MKIDQKTGEILPENIAPLTDMAPAIILDVSEVEKYHAEPMKLVEKINAQAGHIVFDVQTKKGRDACRSNAAQIIKCIAPACKESIRLADEAKKVVNQSLNFRKMFDAGVREIAEYHRKPLTEWEEKQERIAEQERIFAKKMENMRLYHIDWDDAIAYDELFTLRKEKAIRDSETSALKKLQEQKEYEKQLQAQAIIKERERHDQEIEQLKMDQEAQRLKIQQEEESKARKKAEAEQAEKLEAALKEQRAEGMARIKEENRLEREKQAGIEQLQRTSNIVNEANIKKVSKDVDNLLDTFKPFNAECLKTAEKEKSGNFSDPVTISKSEYLTLTYNSDRLHKIIELWKQANRMTESANRADQSSVRNSELKEAQKVRNEAIKIIESLFLL